MDNNIAKATRLTTRVSIALMLALFLQGCASKGYQTVPRTTSGKIQQVNSGTVVATRSVVIEGEAGYLGRTGGAIVGSAVGQTAGKGTGRTLAAAGGAVVGGIVGGMIEKELSKKVAQELTVDLDDGHTVVVVQEPKDIGFVEGDRVSVTHTPSGEANVSHAHYQTDGIY
ncbi:glycine zipper domain-containing protein [Pelagicoccus sp. SDUM812002]|uniref:glycine zipper domain-containing protein n=1 Tax=Pelagicoccus sp. SDUM812002 TaxID=3041266 RepID=UPI00280F9802|nr:glycine zipper domain-containing protein [Pelagicoccus sp. SDUM812002]MDQ8188138.1 glycine zipper domain-containing protein [Pelagicoccus sp. SDUM812002]